MEPQKDEIVKERATKFLRGILEEIVSTPENLEITGEIDAMGLNLIVKLDEKDIGSLLGAKGQNIDILRQFMRMWGYKNRAKVNVYVPPTNKELKQ